MTPPPSHPQAGLSAGDFDSFSRATVADLMSRGVRTVEADQPLTAIIRELRRIGHEGYPVVAGGRVVGLLTLRDADRALEHNLTDITVRAVMAGGSYTLSPDDTVATLAQTMAASGWGQLPVAEGGALVGIVTRTDLIRHLARFYAATAPTQITPETMRAVLGAAISALIDSVSAYARETGARLYLVGGVVRDLLLRRPNYDIDFVVESDEDALVTAAAFARGLQARYGGEVSAYAPFGTAKWKLTGVSLGGEGLPGHIDFATARREFYEHPTALPTVSGGSIKLDLGRRDFTINTLAVQLSPEAGRVLDFYGGLHDLERGLVRVLHSLSFVDDPTRVLRAARFAQRLGFSIEPRTAELITGALAMLRRITGERVRNEISLLLEEAEPERALLDLQARGALTAIHPAFTLSPALVARFAQARALAIRQQVGVALVALYWHLLGAECSDPTALAERLLAGKAEAESWRQAAALLADCRRGDSPLTAPDARPSQIVARLDGLTDPALLAVWVIHEDSLTRARLEDYIFRWRALRPATSGTTLRALGLPPGPLYRQILDRLRAARLDGEVRSDAEEDVLLHSLIEDHQA